MGIAVIEHTEYPFAKGNLTSDGIQWSAEKNSVAADTDVEVESATIRPPALGAIIELEFGLTAAFRAVASATADLKYKWQARNQGGAWVDLHTEVTKSDIGTSYIEETRSGRFKPAVNFDSLEVGWISRTPKSGKIDRRRCQNEKGSTG